MQKNKKMDYQVGLPQDEHANSVVPRSSSEENEFSVDIQELSTWFIEDNYLVESSSGVAVADPSHSHGGCEGGSANINPMSVSIMSGVKMKRVTISHVPASTPAEPVYPDLIRQGELGDIGYSLKDG